LTTKEIGEALQISIATVEREWSFSRAWLSDAIAGDRRIPRPKDRRTSRAWTPPAGRN
jgi:hypothetical protein